MSKSDHGKTHDFMLDYRNIASINLYNKCISLGLEGRLQHKHLRAITTQ
jgi:hypothetical protein